MYTKAQYTNTQLAPRTVRKIVPRGLESDSHPAAGLNKRQFLVLYLIPPPDNQRETL